MDTIAVYSLHHEHLIFDTSFLLHIQNLTNITTTTTTTTTATTTTTVTGLTRVGPKSVDYRRIGQNTKRKKP